MPATIIVNLPMSFQETFALNQFLLSSIFKHLAPLFSEKQNSFETEKEPQNDDCPLESEQDIIPVQIIPQTPEINLEDMLYINEERSENNFIPILENLEEPTNTNVTANRARNDNNFTPIFEDIQVPLGDERQTTDFDSASEVNSFKCGKCKYSTTVKGNLKKHEDAVHNGKVFPCEKCEYKATNKD